MTHPAAGRVICGICLPAVVSGDDGHACDHVVRVGRDGNVRVSIIDAEEHMLTGEGSGVS
jgi:hypothetical protein